MKILKLSLFQVFVFILILVPCASVLAYTNATQYLFGNSDTVDGHLGLENISYDYSNDGWLKIIATYSRSSCCYASYPPSARIFSATNDLQTSFPFGEDTSTYRLFWLGGTTNWYTIEYQFSTTTITQAVYPRNSTTSVEFVTVASGQNFLRSFKANLRNAYPPNDEGEYTNDAPYFINTPPVWVSLNGSTTPAYSLPLNPSDYSDIVSWYDHDSSLGTMTRYTGTIYSGDETTISDCDDFNAGFGCYDGHHAIDYATVQEGKNILSVASGTVTAAGWENPSDHGQGFGYRVRLYHPQYDESTVYGHATTTQTYVIVDDTVSRGETILLSGNTGDSGGPHLHFGVFEGNNGTATYAIDPYGWSATTTDPVTKDRGYLWEKAPPAL